MLGQLPQELTVNGKVYAIRSDYRDILRIILAYNDEDLTNDEKVYVCLHQFYKDIFDIPHEDYPEAYKQAMAFISAGAEDDGKQKPKTINWEKDEQLMFAAVNQAARTEVRAIPYLHWWTFLGFFQSIDRDSTWGAVLTIRQKRAKHKKLDKAEEEFYKANLDICELSKERKNAKSAESELAKIYQDLLKGGGSNGKQ